MLVSLNLNSIPFLSSTDATRASMAAKQIQQTLTSPNTEIPYVIGSEYHYLTSESSMGIIIAQDDGKVQFCKDDLLILFYYKLNKLEEIYLPKIKKIYSNYGSTLRYCMKQNETFKKGDIIAYYDSFLDNVPTYGYNTFTAFLPFFGFNHEDSIVISESFADRAQVVYADKIYVPIYEYTMMIPLYNSVKDSYVYFPAIGQKLKDDVLCCMLLPKDSEDLALSSDTVKNSIQNMLKNMTLSGILNINSIDNLKFVTSNIKTKIERDAYVSDMKIHRLKKSKDINMIDKNLQDILEKLYTKVYANRIVDIVGSLREVFDEKYVKTIIAKYYLCTSRSRRNELSLQDMCYLLEFDLCKIDKTYVGDKLCNRYANKGVISLIIPDELRPIAIQSNKPIDLIFNPFGVFSRMNPGQILETLVSKPVMYCDEKIKNNPESVIDVISWLNENVLKFIDIDYYNRVSIHIIENLKKSSEFRDKFINSIMKSNLFVEAPCFAESIKLKDLIRNEIKYNEDILIKKELIDFMKSKIDINLDLPLTDITIPNIFCGPMYIQKLSKIASKIINARDFGVVKSITRQPTKGRARGGGSRLGQMEIEALIANGTERALKELISTKSDWEEGKADLLKQLITTNEYRLPENRDVHSRTKDVVNIQIQFLKS